MLRPCSRLRSRGSLSHRTCQCRRPPSPTLQPPHPWQASRDQAAWRIPHERVGQRHQRGVRRPRYRRHQFRSALRLRPWLRGIWSSRRRSRPLKLRHPRRTWPMPPPQAPARPKTPLFRGHNGLIDRQRPQAARASSRPGRPCRRQRLPRRRPPPRRRPNRQPGCRRWPPPISSPTRARCPSRRPGKRQRHRPIMNRSPPQRPQRLDHSQLLPKLRRRRRWQATTLPMARWSRHRRIPPRPLQSRLRRPMPPDPCRWTHRLRRSLPRRLRKWHPC